jgi:hypothetical protein
MLALILGIVAVGLIGLGMYMTIKMGISGPRPVGAVIVGLCLLLTSSGFGINGCIQQVKAERASAVQMSDFKIGDQVMEKVAQKLCTILDYSYDREDGQLVVNGYNVRLAYKVTKTRTISTPHMTMAMGMGANGGMVMRPVTTYTYHDEDYQTNLDFRRVFELERIY